MSEGTVNQSQTPIHPVVIERGRPSVTDPSATNGSSATIVHIKKKVEAIGSDPKSNTVLSTADKGYVCPDFIIESDKGVFIDLSKLSGPKSSFRFVNDVFLRGYYFRGLEYPALMATIYDFSKIEEYRNEKTDAGKQPIVKIASGIKKFDEERASLYQAPRVFGQGMQAAYPFVFPFVKRDGTQTEGEMDIDEFIAAMWRSGIRFGLSPRKIKTVLEQKKSEMHVIAQGRNYIPWKAARMEPIVDLDVDRRVRDGDSAKRVDIHKLEQSHAEVKEGDRLYKRIPPENGTSGWTVFGTRINPPKLPSYPIGHYKGEGVRVEIEREIEYLVADRDGCPREIKRNLVRDGKVVGEINQVHVHTEVAFHEIGRHTWSVTTNSDVFSKKSITRDTEGKNVTTEEDVETANVRASENVNVLGNVFGSIVSGSWKVSVTQKWRVVSDEGSISIGKIAQNAYLEAKNGTVRAWDMEKTTAVAKRVEVSGDAVNCTFIADEVIVKGKMIGCRIISGKSISVQESGGKGSQENVLRLFSVDLKESIQEKQNLLSKEEMGAQKIENDIDATLVSRSLNTEKNADEKRKWFHQMVTLMDVFTDPRKLKQEKYQVYVPPIQKHITILRILNQNDTWKKLREHYVSIKQLSEEIAQETAAMEWAQKDLHIEVGDIQCPTLVQWIKFPENRQLLDLTAEEIDAITASLNKPNTAVPYKLEKIPSPTKWSFEWQPA